MTEYDLFVSTMLYYGLAELVIKETCYTIRYTPSRLSCHSVAPQPPAA